MNSATVLYVVTPARNRRKKRKSVAMGTWRKKVTIAAMLELHATNTSLSVASYELKKLITTKTWQYMEDTTNDGDFYETYRMNRQSFYRLLAKVSQVPNFVQYGSDMCRRHDLEPLDDEIKLAIALHVLSGSTRIIDVARIYGRSKSCIQKWFFVMLPIIVTALPLPINLEACAANDTKLKELADDFKGNSEVGIDRCIGAIDGCAVRIRQPLLVDVPNPSNYFNRKGFHALNLQAMCNASRRFTWYCCKSAGSTHDSTAIVTTALFERLKDGFLTESGYFIVGVDAYALEEFIIVPFAGKQVEYYKDNFNYFISQLRINIECAFGMLVNKWRILTTALPYTMNSNMMVIRACLLLHNFCIDKSVWQGRYNAAASVDGNNIWYEQNTCIRNWRRRGHQKLYARTNETFALG